MCQANNYSTSYTHSGKQQHQEAMTSPQTVSGCVCRSVNFFLQVRLMVCELCVCPSPSLLRHPWMCHPYFSSIVRVSAELWSLSCGQEILNNLLWARTRWGIVFIKINCCHQYHCETAVHLRESANVCVLIQSPSFLCMSYKHIQKHSCCSGLWLSSGEQGVSFLGEILSGSFSDYLSAPVVSREVENENTEATFSFWEWAHTQPNLHHTV